MITCIVCNHIDGDRNKDDTMNGLYLYRYCSERVKDDNLYSL